MSEDTGTTIAALEAANASLRRRLAELESVEAELRTSRNTLASIFRAAPTGIGLVRDRVILHANERMCAMLGYTEDELIGHNARMLYPSQAEYEMVGREKYRQIAECGVGTVETVWVTRDGTALDILLSSAPIDSDDPSSDVIFTALDISTRRRASAELMKSAEIIRAITDSVTDSVFVKDLDRRYTFVNKAMAEALRMPASDLLGRTPEEVFEPGAAATVAEVDAATLAGETVNTERTLTVGGRDTIFHTVQTPMRDPEGRIIGVCGIVRDVTALRLAEEERLALMTQVQQAQRLESLGVLAGGIAHDFNNLLVGILGNASLALLDLPPESTFRPFVVDIETAAERARDLIRQVLTYSGTNRPRTEPIDLRELIREMAKLLNVSTRTRATIRLDFAPDTPTVVGDPVQLRQIVMNLVTNAIDALGTSPGEITIRTGREPCADRQHCEDCHLDLTGPVTCTFLEVVDTGCGMPRETIDRIFDPFFTTKLAGHGLGLAVVRGIVRSHRGTIRVISETGRGSTFRVVLPEARLQAAPKGRADSGEFPAWRGTGTVLLVDDEELVRKVGSGILVRLGFEVVTAEDGARAVSIFRAEPDLFDVVLLDLAMPTMDGEECSRLLRGIRPEVPIVLTSGFADSAVLDRLDRMGLNGFVHKPYRHTELAEAIQLALGSVTADS